MNELSAVGQLRSLQALDSPRHATHSELAARNTFLAELQVLASVLFGERIVVSEAVSFDSLGFLRVADNVLRKRPAPSRLSSPVYDPFVLACSPEVAAVPPRDQYRSMIARHLGDPTFFSGSAFGSINSTAQVQELGAMVAKREDDALHRQFQQHQDIRVFAESLARLERYFAAVPPILAQPAEPLQPALDRLLLFDPEGDEPYAEKIAAVRELARELVRGHGLECNRRSNLYSLLHRLGRAGPEAQGLKEYVDNYYCRRVAARTRANSAVYSPALSEAGEYSLAALLASRKTTGHDLEWAEGAAYITLPIAPENKSSAETIDWAKMWDIVLAEETIRSQQKLAQALRPWPIFKAEGLARAEAALVEHVGLLDRKLRSAGWSATYDGDWIRVRYTPGRGNLPGALSKGVIAGFSGAAGIAVAGAVDSGLSDPFEALGIYQVASRVFLNSAAIKTALEGLLTPVQQRLAVAPTISRGSLARLFGARGLQLPPRPRT